MFKTLIYLALIAGAAWGLDILHETKGTLVLEWFGRHIETSPMVGLAFVLVAAIILLLLWKSLSFALKVPTVVAVSQRARKRALGLDALSRGIVAANAGDLQRAEKAAADAKKHLPAEPLTLLLEAQTAQLAGDRVRAARVFREMTAISDTKLLGLRGLHAESLRQGDQDAAHAVALQAQNARPLCWSGQAVFDRHTAAKEWAAAHDCIAQNIKARIVDAETARRQKAVLDTAIAMDVEATDPARAIKLLRAALAKEATLVPAAVLLGRLLSRKGDMRAASKMLEGVYAKAPHPEIARAYLDVRVGDSAADRLNRAKSLARCAPEAPESAMVVAAAAIGARDFALARQVMAPLVASGQRPTARMCVIMAELEDRENDAQGLVREWLSRATRAPRDAMWFADGNWSRQWSPISPVTGKLDAYVWAEPKEELSGPMEEPPPAGKPAVLESAPPPATIEPPAKVEIEAKAELQPEPEPAAETVPPAQQKAADIAHRSSPQPVIFPLATPPDDPGPKPAGAARTF
ncbi:heme biosynthesis protein HemY [Rhodoblastus acidophilus]|uniref:Heme biosynthesis protein HemY n=1 Tax=Rhodoblastus acidophilus TaxID=1074 RepID=A0A6N8DLR2_RHOAC|nr:heme biosynthesis HemY N-terminal domain-containing protein [Rhodoblastus acidophilus]MCW2274894.1 HemY protein [Rhodoblastus acidophilus]MTV31522.1 heme biosynthesis protein HemY [Rhodoblastus acidophilus]